MGDFRLADWALISHSLTMWSKSPITVKWNQSKCVRTYVLNFGLFFGAVVFAAGCFMADGKVPSKPKPPRVVVIHMR